MTTPDQAALAECLAGTARGDRAAFAELYRRTSAKLFGIVRRILVRRELAEDALQETYVRIWANAPRFDKGAGSPMTWMIAIARNQAIDLRRRSAERISGESVALEDAEQFAFAGAGAIEAAPDRRRLATCLEALAEQPRAMVLLAYHQGWSREELSKRFDRPVATVKTMLRRGLAALKDCLDG